MELVDSDEDQVTGDDVIRLVGDEIVTFTGYQIVYLIGLVIMIEGHGERLINLPVFDLQRFG